MFGKLFLLLIQKHDILTLERMVSSAYPDAVYIYVFFYVILQLFSRCMFLVETLFQTVLF